MLAACQNEQSSGVEKQIEEINLENGSDSELISEVRNEYDNLSTSDQKKVDNYDALLAAEEAFNKQIINGVEEAINSIEVVDIQSDDIIANARLQFDALTREQQKNVSNLNVLLNAEKIYSETIMKDAEKLVNDMKNLTTNDFSLVDELRTVYAKLSDKQVIQLSDIQNLEGFISTFKVNSLDKQISSINYESGVPNQEQIDSILTTVETYNELNQNEIDSLVNKKQFDQITKEYIKYFDKRKKDDQLYNRYTFITESTPVPYKDLMKFPDSFKNQKIKLDVEILEIDQGNIVTSDTFIVHSKEDKQELYQVRDKRDVKEPILSVGDSITIFGEYKKLENYVVFSEAKGILGTNFNREKLEEHTIPVIDLKYTNVDNLGVIASKNPLLSVDINEDLELLKNQLYTYIKELNID